ncbi:MAG TPA: hypothetical protein VMF66_18055 [Candidatus Acidoferrum sp.]|nr:hypothetical protein [Candidatus Acidoferrum sp.]
MFSYKDFPPGTFGGHIWGQGTWSEVVVYPAGCLPDGKCESVGRGDLWIDGQTTINVEHAPPRHISGKYEIDLNGKRLTGSFVAKRHTTKHPVRICM